MFSVSLLCIKMNRKKNKSGNETKCQSWLGPSPSYVKIEVVRKVSFFVLKTKAFEPRSQCGNQNPMMNSSNREIFQICLLWEFSPLCDHKTSRNPPIDQKRPCSHNRRHLEQFFYTSLCLYFTYVGFKMLQITIYIIIPAYQLC